MSSTQLTLEKNLLKSQKNLSFNLLNKQVQNNIYIFNNKNPELSYDQKTNSKDEKHDLVNAEQIENNNTSTIMEIISADNPDYQTNIVNGASPINKFVVNKLKNQN